MPNRFGFPTEPSTNGNFIPIVKYDARAGRIYRVDRIESNGNFANEAIDITTSFKAIIDLENIETGWEHFSAGSAPQFVLVPIGNEFPERPSANYKTGIRFMLKLSKGCCGDKSVREIAGTAKAFRSGIEALFEDYLAEKDKHPNKLPVVVLERVTPIKTGEGEKSSTNFRPEFRIVDWVPRGDLVFVPKAMKPAQVGQQPQANGATSPSTGSTRAEAPKSDEGGSADDFG
jgi:hypothetical protein